MPLDSLPSRRQLEAELVACLPGLRKQALARVRNATEADDLVQDVAIRVLTSADQFVADGPNAFRRWVSTILRNLVVDRARSSFVRTTDPAPIEDHADISIPSTQDRTIEAHEALVEIKRLKPTLRAVIVHFVEGQSYEAVSESLGVPVGTVRSRLFRARGRLRKKLAA